jgi:hypothetical protein
VTIQIMATMVEIMVTTVDTMTTIIKPKRQLTR